MKNLTVEPTSYTATKSVLLLPFFSLTLASCTCTL